MVTSRSTEKGGWTAGAQIFSGRPDPVWDVRHAVAKKLVEIWDSLPVANEKAEPDSGHLGYRGCFLRDAAQQEWQAFGGVVSLRTKSRVEVRADRVRKFERALIASAPKGVLPEGLLSGAWNQA